jgi:hypothetical protein
VSQPSRKFSALRVAPILFWPFGRVGPVLFFALFECSRLGNIPIQLDFLHRPSETRRAPKYLYKVLCTDKGKALPTRTDLKEESGEEHSEREGHFPQAWTFA